MLRLRERMWIVAAVMLMICAGVGRAAITLTIDGATAPDEITVQVGSVVTIGIASDGGAYGGYIGHDDCQTGQWAGPLQSLVPSGPRVDVIDADGDLQDIWWFFQVTKYNPGDPAIPAGEHFRIDYRCTAEGDCLIVLYAIDGVTLVDSLMVHQEPQSGDGLVAHWKLDETSGNTAYDAAGGKNGTVYGAAWTAGLIGGALSFDGVDDYVALPNNEPIWLPREDFAVSLWCRFAQEATGLEVLVDLNAAASGTASNRLGCAVNRLDTGITGFSMVTGNGTLEALYGNTPLAGGEWYHIVAVRQGTTQALYINTVVDGARTCSPDPIDYAGNYDDDKVNLGRVSRAGITPAGYFGGLIDDVRLYNQALSQTQVDELYGAGVVVEPVGLVSHWKLDEGTGLTAFDSAGANDGVLEGGATWAAGLIGGALGLDGVNDRVVIPSDPSLNMGSAFSISMWIYRNRQTGSYERLFSRSIQSAPGSPDFDYYLQIHGDNVIVGVGSTGTSGHLVGGTVLTNRWHHVVGIKHPSNPVGFEIYVDGVRAAHGITQGIMNACRDMPWNAYIGWLGSDGDSFYGFDGRIDDVRLYNRPLTATEVAYLYSQGGTLPPVPQTYHVDGDNGSDGNDGAARETAFATIQHAIDLANSGDTILVWPGFYDQPLNYMGKAVAIRSADDPAVLAATGADAISFHSGEGPTAILKNFIITGSDLAVSCNNGSSPTLENLSIVANTFGIAAYENSNPDIRNCILYNNRDGDLFGCTAQFSWVEDEQGQTDAGLVAHWKFDEGSGSTAFDSAGNNHGQLYGAQWVTGRIGGALGFDGVDDYLRVPDADVLTPQNTMTISYWLLNEGTGTGVYKLAFCASSRAYAFNVGAAGDLHLRIYSSASTYDDLASNGVVGQDGWHHLVGTFDHGQAALYIDGSLDVAASMSVSSIMNDTQPLTIGGFWDYCGTTRFRANNGQVDDVRIYNRVLSAWEVQSLYQYGIASGGGADSGNNGLVAHWRFDDGTGSVAIDSVGNNHGQIHGAQWAAGKLGSALDFDGVNDHVQVPDADTLTPSNAMTLAFWSFSTGGTNFGIYKFAFCPEEPYSPGNSRAYGFAVADTDRVHLRIHSSSSTYDELISTGTAARNQWHHLLAVFDQGAAAIYIDGALDSQATLSIKSIMNDVQPLTIGGAWSYCGTDRFLASTKGIIDDVRIYNRALSAAEAQNLYLYAGDSSVDPDPLFADADAGDYHIKSTRGRYWPDHDVWVLDKVTSPAVDGGDPASDIGGEPAPHGGRINMGAYGGTAYASLSPKPEVIVSPDLNQDGVVNLLDLALLAENWLAEGPIDPPTENVPPQVEVIQPSAGQQFAAYSTIPVVAEASDADGQVVSVSFHINGAPLSTDNDGSDGWTASWSAGGSGTYNITAAATDNNTASTLSSPVAITLTGGR